MADDIPIKERMMTVDLLIGNDYYNEIIGDEKFELDKGFYLVNSSLGWIFSSGIPCFVNEGRTELSMLMEESFDISQASKEL